MQPPARVAVIAVLTALIHVGAAAQTTPPKTTTPPAQNPPAAQTPKPATPPGTATPPAAAPAQPRPPAPRPAAKPTPAQVFVRDVSGAPITGAKVFVSGPVTLELTTDANGVAMLSVMPDGTYRLRFERDGFTTFEREVTAKAGQPAEIYVALRMAPPPPAPAPAPAPTPAPALPPPVVSTGPAGPPVFVSIPEFLDKNYIRREPLKESVLGCLGDSTTRLLQLHESIAEHTHSEMDEMLYVVAGEGAIRIKGESTSVTAGSLTIVPRGLQHSIERRGKNPLMVLSTLSGAPCRAEPPAPSKVTSNNKK